MLCANCRTALIREDGCRSCPGCGGVWFEHEEARAYFGFLTSAVPPEHGGTPQSAVSSRPCPSCATALHHIEVDDELCLDQCDRCLGLFFDAGESLKLRGLLAAGHGGPIFRMRVMQIVGGPGSGPYR